MKNIWTMPLLMSILFILSACDNNTTLTSGGDDGGGSSSSARISGSVTLSSSVAGSNKPVSILMKDYASAPKLKASATKGYVVANKPVVSTTSPLDPFFAIGDNLANAFVYLYDADHPEWLTPVAQDITDANGAYSMSTYGCTADVSVGDCVSSAASNGGSYSDGDGLPVGFYTMLVFKPSTFDPILGVTTDPIVAVLPTFKATSGDVTVEEMEAEVSDVLPRVMTMFGQNKNTDGTDTWGSTTLNLPGNAGLQVSFDMAMSRGSVQNIVVANGSVISGSWKLSPDWMTATFAPDSDLAAGVYTVTIPATVTNVYANAIGHESIGTFTATAVDNAAPTVSLSPTDGATGVSVSSGIRLTSNEALDVNSLILEAAPSVGDRPGLLLIGENAGSYEYEFILQESLHLGTDYTYTISGIKDLSGNSANNILGTFSTEGAASAIGVDPGADPTTQSAQVAISEIFAKWTRAINDRNLPGLQAVMAGSFTFEYNVQLDGFNSEDVNRNGRLSLNEFMNMMEDGLIHWEYCETTASGDIVGNVNLSDAETGDFEFTLLFDSLNQGQECNQGGSDDAMYATVKFKNGAWKIARLSEGFDHRGTTLPSVDLIEATLSQGGVTMPSGSVLSSITTEVDPLTFTFDATTGVNSYIFMLANVRDPRHLGFAFVVDADDLADPQDPTAPLSITVPDAQATANQGLPNGAVPIQELFGFESDRDWGIDNSGEQFFWEVIGLGTISASDFLATNGAPGVVELVRDINAVSAVKKFKNPGDIKELDISVTDSLLNPLTYDIYKNGFDAGTDGSVILTVTSPNAADIGGVDSFPAAVYVNSSIGWADFPLIFVDNLDGTATASVTIDLFNGWNWIDLMDGVDMYANFQVVTTGGITPTLTTVSITDNGTTQTNPDLALVQSFIDYQFADANPGATTLDIIWEVDSLKADAALLDPGVLCNNTGGAWSQLSVNIWNNSGAYDRLEYCQDPTNWTITAGSISYTGLEIYLGENWVHLELYGDDTLGNPDSWKQTGSGFGVYTDTGVEYVPPVSIADVTGDAGASALLTGDWGQGSDWNATAVTATGNDVIITGTFENDPTSASYNAGADGAWTDGIAGDPEFTVTPDGLGGATFALTITLYNGWNWISINADNEWYGINIYTDNGAVLPKPVIVNVNEIVPVDDFGQLVANISACTATVNGTAPANTQRMWVDWHGSSDTDSYWEGQELQLTGGGTAGIDTDQNWSATFQVIGGANAYNFISVYDDTNQTWAGVEVRTSDVSCTYTKPVLTIDSVVAGGVTLIDPYGYNEYGVDDTSGGSIATTATTAVVSGTSSMPGRSIKLMSYACGSNEEQVVQASSTANLAGTYDWTATMSLYDYDVNSGSVYYQYIDISDGQNWQSISVLSDSNVVPVSPISISVAGATENTLNSGCGYSEWDGSAATTLTVSGTTTGTQDGFGEFWTNTSWGTFEIIGGAFNFDVNLFDGWNHIGISDVDRNWTSLNITTTNGVLPPQYVYITSPSNGDVGVVAGATVTGDFGVSGFVPDNMNAYVEYYDIDTGMYVSTWYSTYAGTTDVPMAYTSGTSFTFDLPADMPATAQDIYISVDGCGPDGCHGHSIRVNSTYPSDEHFYKPGTGDTVNDAAMRRKAMSRR